MNFDFLKHCDFKIIIAEIKKSRKGNYIMTVLICTLLCVLDIHLYKHGLHSDIFTFGYISLAATSLTIYLIKLYNNICDKIDEKKEKSITPEQCKRAISFMVDKELDIITEFIESKQPVLYLDNLQDEIETLNTYKKLGIIEDSEIANGYIRIKFKKDFINIIKERLNQLVK